VIYSLPFFYVTCPEATERFWMVSLLQLMFYVFVMDVSFYGLHRLMHYRSFYTVIHKRHHEFIHPVSMVALYAHPVEHVFVNLFPIMLGPMMWAPSLAVAYLLVIGSTVNTVMLAHSNIKWVGDPHVTHHQTPNKEYGIGLFMDKLFKSHM
jgi:methylsterol monooxygenase